MSLREVNEDNRAAVEALAVTAEQSKYVGSVTQSLQDAKDYPETMPWYRAIYADDEPVGFVLLADGVTDDDPTLLGPYFLWRLLIDQRFQGRGYGKAALDLIVDYVRTRPDARVLLTSHTVGPASPVDFYLRYGFRRTGEFHEGEPVLELSLSE